MAHGRLYILEPPVPETRRASCRPASSARRFSLLVPGQPPRPVDRYHGLQLVALAQRRPTSRRPLRGGGGIGRAAQRVLDGHHGRRRFQDERRRRHLDPGDRPLLRRHHRRRRGRRVESRHRLRRRRRVPDPRQHLARRRRLQDHRCRPHLDLPRTGRDAPYLEDPGAPAESRPRLRGGAGSGMGSQSRARDLQVE